MFLCTHKILEMAKYNHCLVLRFRQQAEVSVMAEIPRGMGTMHMSGSPYCMDWHLQ